MNRKHAVVTGGGGFLGSSLIESLLSDKFQTTSIDNFGSGRQENLSSVQDQDAFSSLTHDIRDPLPEFESLDVIYHFASRASPADFKEHGIEIALTNSWGTRNVLETARKHDAKVILASTSEVYGNPETHPQSESYNGNVNPRGIRAPYDEGKRFGEALSIAYQQEYDLDIRTVRIFNTYGPRMRLNDGRVVPNFITQALTNEDLTIYGDGEQTRSFCYVDDLIRGIRALGDAPAEVAQGEVVNLGSEREITIEEFAELVIETLDTNSGTTYLERPDDDPEIRRPDVTKAKSMLEWEQKIPLEEGIKKTSEAFETRIEE